MWQNLVRVVRPDQGEIDGGLAIQDEALVEDPVDTRLDEEQLLKDYKNSYWTRVLDL